MPNGAGLKHHDADGMRDDVVQLPRDPGALLGHRDAGERVAFTLGVARPLLGCFGLHGSLTHGKAGDPADGEEHRQEEELAGGVARIAVDDDRRPAEHDGQPEPRLAGLAEIAQQQRSRHSGRDGADREHDQATVHQRERPAEQPDRGGRGKAKAPACEQRQHDQGSRRNGEPERRARLPHRVVPEGDLEGALECREHDQDVEAVPAGEAREPVHAAELLQAVDPSRPT